MAENTKIIETLDENGKIVKFELYDIVEFEEKEYALLIPVDTQDEEEVVLMRLVGEDDDYMFKAIEDEEEFEAVSEYIESLED